MTRRITAADHSPLDPGVHADPSTAFRKLGSSSVPLAFVTH